MAELYLDPEFDQGSAFEVIAQASGLKPRADRWTVLTLYHRRDTAPADYPPVLAEIVGETTIEGEERRVRRGGFDSVLTALAWGAFNGKSALFGELQRKATAWLEAKMKGTGMVFISGARLDDASLARLLASKGGDVVQLAGTVEDRVDRAIALLRIIVDAANKGEQGRLEAALAVASDFLGEIDAGKR